MPMRRSFATLVVATLAVASGAGCTRAPKDSPKVVAETARDGGTSSSSQKAPPPSSPFHAVVSGKKLGLVRIAKGPVLATDAGARAVYTLSEQGEIAPLAPLSTLAAERIPDWLELGRVEGFREHVFLERATFAGRGGATIESAVANLERGTASKVQRNGHVSSVFAWKNDSVIAYEANDASVMGPYTWGRPGRFVTIAGRPGPLPRLPSQAVSVRGDFVGYPSGRIFAFAGLRAKSENEQADTAYLWDFADGLVAKPVKMPSEVRGLVQGREEKETVAYGLDWVSRFDGNGWTPIAGAPRDVTSASIADDGSLWLVSGEDVWSSESVGAVLAKVPLPENVTPSAIVARTKDDVWLTSDADGGGLYHSKPVASPKKLAESPDDFARLVLAEKEPPPFTRGCAVPFLAIAPEGEISDADVLAFAEKTPEALSGGPIVGSTKAGRVVGIDLTTYSGYDDQATNRVLAFAAMVKAKRPSARLLCTRPKVEREITAKK